MTLLLLISKGTDAQAVPKLACYNPTHPFLFEAFNELKRKRDRRSPTLSIIVYHIGFTSLSQS
jgi:hypothetical protein